MDTGLQGKTVLITGASRNMGRNAALAFAREGARLALCTRASADELDEVAGEARALGAEVLAGLCDVTDGTAVAEFVGKVQQRFGGVDVLLNAVGHRSESAFLETDFTEWTRNIEVNLGSVYHTCRSVIPLMMSRKFGRIINVSGTAAAYLGGGVAKGTVKLGIIGFTRGLAREFGPCNITANCIAPGAVERDGREFVLPPTQVLRRPGRQEEIISLILYLASENAGFVTGQCYAANGGTYFQ